MFWAYISNYKQNIKNIHNQIALRRLKCIIRSANKKQIDAAFKTAKKKDNTGELDFYLEEKEEYWIFIYPFNDCKAHFAKNKTIEEFNKQIDELILEETKDIINSVLEKPIGGFILPRKKDLLSKWFWLSTVFTNNFWLLVYILIGLFSSLIFNLMYE